MRPPRTVSRVLALACCAALVACASSSHTGDPASPEAVARYGEAPPRDPDGFTYKSDVVVIGGGADTSSAVASPVEEIPPPPDLTKVKPCELVTHAEAEKLARTPLDKGVVGADTESPSCTYNGPMTGPIAQLWLVVGPGAKKTFDIDKSLGKRPRLAGLADEAYTQKDAFKVYFRKGTTWVFMSLARLEDHPYYMKTLVSLAHSVAARLPNG